jgi:hypothetical protein
VCCAAPSCTSRHKPSTRCEDQGAGCCARVALAPSSEIGCAPADGTVPQQRFPRGSWPQPYPPMPAGPPTRRRSLLFGHGQSSQKHRLCGQRLKILGLVVGKRQMAWGHQWLRPWHQQPQLQAVPPLRSARVAALRQREQAPHSEQTGDGARPPSTSWHAAAGPHGWVVALLRPRLPMSCTAQALALPFAGLLKPATIPHHRPVEWASCKHTPAASFTATTQHHHASLNKQAGKLPTPSGQLRAPPAPLFTPPQVGCAVP